MHPVCRTLLATLSVTALALGLAREGGACDLHALRTAGAIVDDTPGLRLGVAEQWTRFATLQRGDDEIRDPYDERLESSITQLVAEYRFTERLGVGLYLPVIDRTFRRVTPSGSVEHDDVSGIGDLALLGDVTAFRRETDESTFRLGLVGGLELPTGNSHRLSEEQSENHTHAPGQGHPVSGIHGHDLALGSGSVDGIVGGDVFWSWRRAFVGASMLYGIRSEGSFDFEYADDLQWSVAPGVVAWRGAEALLAAQAVFSGETKGEDKLDGRNLTDTAATTLYLGPGLEGSWKGLDAEVAVEIPVLTHRTGVQIAPDVRVRGGLRWRF
jgi:hypothetical protein